jgi:predicted nucleotidyltransferase component of viral defense system
MDFQKLDEIKRIAIIALFSDDDLMDCLVLKGGNALDLVYNIADRASLDLDFSTDRAFSDAELPVVEQKIAKVLEETFRANGFEAFDIHFKEVPEVRDVHTPDYWGGYQIEFKVIETNAFAALRHDARALRVNAIEVGPAHKRKLKISISKMEYYATRGQRELDDYTVYVYTPDMIVFEKLRAICQQMPEYTPNTTRGARARDFFDIYTVMEHFGMTLIASPTSSLLKNVFEAKRVPLALIGRIGQYREYHRPDFASVQATVKPNTRLKDFDFYFDYVVDRCRHLKTLWEE